MRFDENPVAAETMIARAQEEWEKSHPRAPGVHASDLIYCLRRAWYKHSLSTHPWNHPAPDSHDDKVLWLAGNGHHAILEGLGVAEDTRAIQIPCLRGDTMHTHWVTATLDLQDNDDLTLEVAVPVEVKTTRKKSTSEYPDMYQYVEQLVTYMLIWHKTVGRLAVLFLCGDYKAVRKAIFRVWDVGISIQEMRLWYEELTRRIHIVETSPTPPVPERFDWECGYCPFASSKGGPCPTDHDAKGRGGDRTGIKKTGFFILDLPEVTDEFRRDQESDSNDGD